MRAGNRDHCRVRPVLELRRRASGSCGFKSFQLERSSGPMGDVPKYPAKDAVLGWGAGFGRICVVVAGAR